MTRKDYITIGAAIIDSKTTPAHSQLSALTDRLCNLFKADNPNFDEKKFRAFVGYEE